LALASQLGIEALFPNNKNNITAQILIDYNPMNITTDANWKYIGFRAEVGYRISFRKEEKPIEVPKPIEKEVIVEKKEPVEIPKPIEPPSPTIALVQPKAEPFMKINDIKVDGKVETGNELLASIPIVNCVFFPRNSSKLPPEYEMHNLHIPILKATLLKCIIRFFIELQIFLKIIPTLQLLLNPLLREINMNPAELCFH